MPQAASLSPSVAALAESVISTMALAKAKIGVCVVMALTMFFGMTVVQQRRVVAELRAAMDEMAPVRMAV